MLDFDLDLHKQNTLSWCVYCANSNTPIIHAVVKKKSLSFLTKI